MISGQIDEKSLGEIKKEQTELWNKFKLKWKISIILALTLTSIFLLFLFDPIPLNFSKKQILFIIIILWGIIAYLFIFEEAIFIHCFFRLEKNYYMWKQLKNEKSGVESGAFSFQEALDIFQNDLLSKITGFKRNNYRKIKRDIFNYRISKVKKEIDIFFNLMIDLLLSKEILEKLAEDESLKEPEIIFELFLSRFKNIFIRNPAALNLIALDSFFLTFNTLLKSEFNEPFNDNKKFVDEYYNKIEKLVEQRDERRFELIKTIIAMFFTIILAILSYKIIESIYAGFS